MQSARICLVLAATLVPCSFSGQATSQSQPKQSEIESADQLFQEGKIAEAGELYSRIAAQNPRDYSAMAHDRQGVVLRLGLVYGGDEGGVYGSLKTIVARARAIPIEENLDFVYGARVSRVRVGSAPIRRSQTPRESACPVSIELERQSAPDGLDAASPVQVGPSELVIISETKRLSGWR